MRLLQFLGVLITIGGIAATVWAINTYSEEKKAASTTSSHPDELEMKFAQAERIVHYEHERLSSPDLATPKASKSTRETIFEQLVYRLYVCFALTTGGLLILVNSWQRKNSPRRVVPVSRPRRRRSSQNN